MKNTLERKVAKIETYVFDCGGFSWCSSCHYTLDEYTSKFFSEKNNYGSDNELQCPGCKSYLSFGETEIQQGGSDF